jgi:hypothetical protein
MTRRASSLLLYASLLPPFPSTSRSLSHQALLQRTIYMYDVHLGKFIDEVGQLIREEMARRKVTRPFPATCLSVCLPYLLLPGRHPSIHSQQLFRLQAPEVAKSPEPRRVKIPTTRPALRKLFP